MLLFWYVFVYLSWYNLRYLWIGYFLLSGGRYDLVPGQFPNIGIPRNDPLRIGQPRRGLYDFSIFRTFLIDLLDFYIISHIYPITYRETYSEIQLLATVKETQKWNNMKKH